MIKKWWQSAQSHAHGTLCGRCEMQSDREKKKSFAAMHVLKCVIKVFFDSMCLCEIWIALWYFNDFQMSIATCSGKRTPTDSLTDSAATSQLNTVRNGANNHHKRLFFSRARFVCSSKRENAKIVVHTFCATKQTHQLKLAFQTKNR